MHALSHQEIRQLAGDPWTFQKGLDYYFAGRVRSVVMEKEGRFHARVQGTRLYHVEAAFKGDTFSSQCDCPAFARSPGICKHVVALLLQLGKGAPTPAKEEIFDPRAQRLLKEFLSLATVSTAARERLFLEPLLYIDEDIDDDHDHPLSLGLKVGPDRLYKVKDLHRFLLDLRAGRPIALTPRITVHSGLGSLSEEDAALMKRLLEIEAWSTAAVRLSPYSANPFFRKDRLLLFGKPLEEVLEALRGRTFTLVEHGYPSPQTIVEEKIPLSFAISDDGGRLLLRLAAEEEFAPLAPEGPYFRYGDEIRRVPDEQSEVLHAFHRAHYTHLNDPIVLPPNRQDHLLASLLPLLEGAGEVSLEGGLRKAFHRAELLCRIYLDEEDGSLVTRLEFRYGEEVFAALAPEAKGETMPEKIVLRDPEGERRMVKTLEELGFIPGADGRFHLGEDRLPEFLAWGLGRLQREAEVFCTQAVKNLRLRRPGPITAGLRLNQADLLEFDFEIEGIDRRELAALFAAVREKKRYFRLRDGSLLLLEDDRLRNLAELTEELDLSARDPAKTALEIPKYQAFYLENRLREMKELRLEQDAALKRLLEAVREPGKTDRPVPAAFAGVLRPYQKTGFRWLEILAAHGLGGILADEMGLGKTIQVLAFILAEKEAGQGPPALVIAPTSLLYNWEAEARRFAPELRTMVVAGSPEERQNRLAELGGVDLVITSYPLLRRDQDLYAGMEFSYCFLDEAQHIKNPQTINARSVKAIRARAKFALTGTPLENSLAELWSIFDFVLPGYLHSRQRFTQRFEAPILRGDRDATSDLARRIKPFVLRRTKKDVLPELPAKIESTLAAELTAEQKKLYLLYLGRTREEVEQELKTQGLARSRLKIFAALTRLRQICCHPALFIEDYRGESGKMLLLEEILEDAFAAGHRILLFSQFTSMLSLIRARLEKRGVEDFYLDGGVKAAERLAAVRAFNAGRGSVFLISLRAGGTGLNLTGADTVIHYDPWWNPAVEDQATDRAHRLGQENVVQVIKLVTRGTIEEKVHELQKAKKALIDSVIRPGETLLEKLSEEEIRALFEP